MNDFLQSLRNARNERQRTVMTRKSYDESFQKPRQFSGSAATNAQLADAIDGLNAHIESLMLNQVDLLDIQEKIAETLERQVIAIEKLLDHLNID